MTARKRRPHVIDRGQLGRGASEEEGRLLLALRTSRSHLFRGARLTLVGGLPHALCQDVLVLFGDDSIAAADLERREPENFVLRVRGYRTSAGRRLMPATWTLSRTSQHSDVVELQVRSRVEPGG